MSLEKRKSARRVLRYTAWIAYEEGKQLGCVLSDISEEGARLDFDNTENIPDNFTLLLSRRGVPTRTCHVIWRQPTQLGVEFPPPPKPKSNGKPAAMRSPALAPMTPEPEAPAPAETAEEPA